MDNDDILSESNSIEFVKTQTYQLSEETNNTMKTTDSDVEMEQISQMVINDRKLNSRIMLHCLKREEHLTSGSETEDHVFEAKK